MEPSLSPEEFEKRVKFYFRDCEESRKVFPDEAGMINYIFQGTDCEDEDAEFEELKTTEGYAQIRSLRPAARTRCSRRRTAGTQTSRWKEKTDSSL